MSEQNIALLRGAIEAFNARDIEAFLAYCDPRIEYHPVVAAVSGAIYRGHDGVRRFFMDLEDAWGGDIRVEPETYFDLGEQILLFYVLHGRGRQSRADVAMPVAMAATWREGLLVYFRGYADRQDALRDLGISEDTLKPIAP